MIGTIRMVSFGFRLDENITFIEQSTVVHVQIPVNHPFSILHSDGNAFSEYVRTKWEP